jgi:hypothetical protein
MMTQADLNAEMVNGKIEQYRGNITSIARDLKCARHTLYSFIENHPTCQTALKNARDSMIDNVESSLYSKALEGEGWAVCFFLKTQGKHRGYVERQELTGADGEEIVIKVIKGVKVDDL